MAAAARAAEAAIDAHRVKEEEAMTEPQLDAGAAFEQLGNELMNDDKDEDIDAKIERALKCPCVAELRDGPCGVTFRDAFACFMRSQEVEKGSDCIDQFFALQNCVVDHPAVFSADVRQSITEDVEHKGPT